MPDWPCLRNGRHGGEQLVLRHAAARLDRAERLGQRLAGEPDQLGLRVEQVHVARPAGHEQEDDALGLGGEVRRLRGERIGAPAVAARAASRPSRCEQRGEREHAEAAAGVPQERAARSRARVRSVGTGADVMRVERMSNAEVIQAYTNSFRLNSARQNSFERRMLRGTRAARSSSLRRRARGRAPGDRPSVDPLVDGCALRFCSRSAVSFAAVGHFVRVEQRQRLRRGRAALALRAAQVAVGHVEDFEEREAQVAAREDVDAAARVIRRVGLAVQPFAVLRAPRSEAAETRRGRPSSGSAGR